jgi:hypothetical protein
MRALGNDRQNPGWAMTNRADVLIGITLLVVGAMVKAPFFQSGLWIPLTDDWRDSVLVLSRQAVQEPRWNAP